MRGRPLSTPNADQSSFLYPDLLNQHNPKNSLLKLEREIDRSLFEAEFEPLYSHRGKPSRRILLMVGLSILKHLESLSDEVLIERSLSVEGLYPLLSI